MFTLGYTPWNKGKKCPILGVANIGHTPWNKGKKTGLAPWKGKKRPELAKSNASKTMFKKGGTPWNDETANMKTCNYCGKLFKCRPSRILKHCSKECYLKDCKLMDKRDKPCVDCGKLIMRKSVRCRSCANVGSFSPAWNGGSSFEPYGIEFNLKLREEIRKRDNYTCQECGYNQKYLAKKMSIHHIDYNKRNNDKSNLISLCQTCHLQTNFNRNDWSKYFINKNGQK